MMRLAPLVPMTSSFSTLRRRTATEIDSHPPTGPEAFGQENITDAVPAGGDRHRSLGRSGGARDRYLCSSALRSATVSGEMPRGWPSTATCAPGGSVVTDTADADGGRAAFISKYCVTSAPAAIVSGTTRSSPPFRTVIVCAPGSERHVSGVIPRRCHR